MKKNISTILAVILIAALFQFPASAAGTGPWMVMARRFFSLKSGSSGRAHMS